MSTPRPSTATDDRHDQVVNVEGVDHPWPRADITVAELRVLGGFGPTDEIIQVDPTTNVEVTLDAAAVVRLTGRHEFGKKIKFKRG